MRRINPDDLPPSSACAAAPSARSCARAYARSEPARSAGPKSICVAPYNAHFHHAHTNVSTATRTGHVCAWQSTHRASRKTRSNHRSTTSFRGSVSTGTGMRVFVQVRDIPIPVSLEGPRVSYHAHPAGASNAIGLFPTLRRVFLVVKNRLVRDCSCFSFRALRHHAFGMLGPTSSLAHDNQPF
jgi:hypothetical protein